MKSENISSPSIREKLALFASTAGGFGLLPGAPGTWGTIPGVLIHMTIAQVFAPQYQAAALISVFLCTCALSYFLTPWAQRYWNTKDPGRFVLDEVAGYLLVPILFRHGELWQIALWGFLFFRLFDIIKPPPARQIDTAMKSAWGVLLDDLVSSFYTVAALYLIMKIGYLFDISWWLTTNDLK